MAPFPSFLHAQPKAETDAISQADQSKQFKLSFNRLKKSFIAPATSTKLSSHFSMTCQHKSQKNQGAADLTESSKKASFSDLLLSGLVSPSRARLASPSGSGQVSPSRNKKQLLSLASSPRKISGAFSPKRGNFKTIKCNHKRQSDLLLSPSIASETMSPLKARYETVEPSEFPASVSPQATTK